jgi:AraC family transcriptional regulator of adaptative response / DNA-3-methyladenine glycosylase II
VCDWALTTSENRECDGRVYVRMHGMDLDHDACYRAVATRDARFDGKFFTAVKTTGVYCRPICPARTPKRQNVTFFPTAAAAHDAGFRPCLRCRPETAPDRGAWRGTSNTVSRGLALIELGALDEGNVEQLAERLGVGERQLRRLFRQHLGATPIGVAQTRRVLLATQLLHETRLPITDVALASGFGSVRRFNESFQRLFARPPTALRRDSRAEHQLDPGGGITVLLRYRPPYDWTATLSYLRKRAIPGVEHVSADQYSRTIEIDGTSGTVVVTHAQPNALRARICCPKLAALPAVIARLRRLFDLTADPDAIGAHLSLDPMLAPLVAMRPGLRVPGAWDGFELAVRAILGQQITVSAASALTGRLVEAHGKLIRAGAAAAGLTHLFPSPRTLAAADLRKLGIPTQRATAVTSLSAATATDPSIFSARHSLEEAVLRLRSVRGIGEWTAQYIAMRELREPDAFPAADLGLLRAMAEVGGRRLTERELLVRAQCWRPWRAYAAHHLWASLSRPVNSRPGLLLGRSPIDRKPSPGAVSGRSFRAARPARAIARTVRSQ